MYISTQGKKMQAFFSVFFSFFSDSSSAAPDFHLQQNP